jgi:hypothetical protein
MVNTPPPAISGTTLTLTPTQLILAPSGATLKFCSRQMYTPQLLSVHETYEYTPLIMHQTMILDDIHDGGMKYMTIGPQHLSPWNNKGYFLLKIHK